MDFFVLGNICLLVAVGVLALPCTCFCFLIVYNDWNKLYVAKRRPSLALMGSIALSCIQFIYLPGVAIEAIITGASEITSHYGVIIVFVPSMYTFFWSVCLRSWFLYYDTNLYDFHHRKAWAKVVDSDFESKNWFKNKESTFGSTSFLLKYALLFTLLLCCLSATWISLDLWTIERIQGWGAVLVFACFGLTMWCKLRSHNSDKLGIKQEIAYMIYNALFFFCIGVSNIFLLEFGILGSKIYDVLFRFVAMSFGMGSLFVVTVVPKNMCDTQSLRVTCMACVKAGDNAKRVIDSVRSARNVSPNDVKKERFGKKWTDIVCTAFGYEQLMEHLQKEFSIENLLFISEYVQVKNVLDDAFTALLGDIQNENNRARYSLLLPFSSTPVTLRSMSSHSHLLRSHSSSAEPDSNNIPVSTIAATLAQKISDISNPSMGHATLSTPHMSNNPSSPKLMGNVPSSSHTNANNSRPTTPNLNEPDRITPKSSNGTSPGASGGTSVPNLFFRSMSSQSHGAEIELNGSSSVSNAEVLLKQSVDATTAQLGLCVVEAFEALYNKYVLDVAELTINVRSTTRRALRELLDRTYFPMPLRSKLSGSNLHLPGTGSRENSKDSKDSKDGGKSRKERRRGSGSRSRSSQLSPRASMRRRGRLNRAREEQIRQRFEKRVEKAQETGETEWDVMKWLLTELILSMEDAVREIESLLNDCYFRFQRETEVYEQVLKAAKKHMHAMGRMNSKRGGKLHDQSGPQQVPASSNTPSLRATPSPIPTD